MDNLAVGPSALASCATAVALAEEVVGVGFTRAEVMTVDAEQLIADTLAVGHLVAIAFADKFAAFLLGDVGVRAEILG